MNNIVKIFRTQKHWICIIVLALVCTGAVFAIDFSQSSEHVQPGNVLLSGGLGFGSASGREYGWSGSSSFFGLSFAADYALANFSLTVGGESGAYYAGGWLDAGIIPFMGRLGYHPNIGVDNLNVYALFKLGFAIFFHAETHLGFGIGLGLGGRYFFTDKIGGFVELGLDRYSFSGNRISGNGSKFFTSGISYKL